MKRYLSTLVLLGLVASTLSACLDGTSPEARTNTACAWYNSNTCCDSEQAAAVFNKPPAGGCAALSTNCQQLYNLFACGALCSPQWTNAIDTSTGQFRVCKSFADHIYSSCSNDQFFDITTASCVKVSSQWTTSQSFWQATGADYDTSDSSPTCFNAGSVAQPMLAFTVVVAALAMLLRF